VNQILFVDSDTRSLEALRSALADQPQGWGGAFVPSAQAALNLLNNRWFDVIFVSADLEGMDGIELLERVRVSHPSIIRVLLSEPLSDARLDRALSVAQRYVAKPWDMPTLVASLESVLGAWPRTDNPLVRTIVGRLVNLPSAVSTYPKLVNAMAQRDTSIEQISRVLATDPGLSAKLLQIVNSAFFGLPFRVASVPQAVSYLGLTALRALTMMTSVAAAAESCATVDGFSATRLQQHSLLCARLARCLVGDRSLRDDAFTGGLLHDIGMLALVVGMNKRYALALRHSERSGRPLHEVEVSFLGTSHVAVGAYLADIWGLPAVVVESIERHHDSNLPATGEHAAVINAVALAQRAAECLEKGDHRFEGVGLTPEQIDAINDEFSLADLPPVKSEALLSI
jgi:putative nucleotidyltransferase with HDIG domain